MFEVKKSYGIICIDYNNIDYSFLMIRKTLSYSFCHFVLCNHVKLSKKIMLRLLNNMTYHEKLDLQTLSYEMLWFRIYRQNAATMSQNLQLKYATRKVSFEQKFGSDKLYLKLLIKNTQNSGLLWEFPKGRKNEDCKELEIDIAKREFNEETGITSTKLRIMYDVEPFIITYKDYGINYYIKYFFATMEDCKERQRSFKISSCFSAETDMCRWISKKDLVFADMSKKSINRIYKIFDKAIKLCKNHIKNKSI